MSDRRCPKCGTVYAGAARFCPRDGNLLVEVQPKPATPPSLAGSGTAVRTPPQPSRGLDRAASLSGELLDARYQVLKKLGEGGMSYVYLAKEVSTTEEVAIKVLSPKLATDKSSVKDGPMDVALGIDILRQLCAGLHHAHELQIVHRDLKPENIMLVGGRDGGGVRAVVMDFGLAKERRAEGQLAKLTATGIILGTPEFMSPEQIRGKQLDARSDIYALGIVAFEMFTGKLPFQGRNAQEMMIARLRGQPLKLRQLRPDAAEGVEKALARAMESSPDARYDTALQFAEALTASNEGGFLSKIKERLK